MIKSRSPLKSIRLFCLECMGDSPAGVAECTDTNCPFHPYRHGTSLAKGKHAPLPAIKRYCANYCLPGAGTEAIRECGGDTAAFGCCPVFALRFGKNPNISAATREQQRQRASMRVAKGVSGFSKSASHVPIEARKSKDFTQHELIPMPS